MGGGGEGTTTASHTPSLCPRAAAVAPLHGAHLRVRRAHLQVGEHAARLGAVAAAGGRVDGAQHREVRPVLAAVLAALHLAVDDAGVLAGAVHMVHLRHVARLLRDAAGHMSHTRTHGWVHAMDTCRIYGHMAGFTLWLVLSPLANFTDNWLNNFFLILARFRQFYKDSRRNRVTMANLAKLILMLVWTQHVVIVHLKTGLIFDTKLCIYILILISVGIELE